MKRSNRFRSAAKLVFGIGLLLCALACAAYGILMIPAIKGIAFQWEYFALIGFVAVIASLVSLILLGIAKASEPEGAEDEVIDPAVAKADAREDWMARASVEIAFTTPRRRGPAKAETVESIDCEERDRERRCGCPLKKLPCNKETLKKVGKIALPVAAVGLFAWSFSKNAKYAKAARRRRDFYRWLG